MVALKSSDIESFVARPDPSRAVVLVFGPDAGLVSERVDAIMRASVDDPADPFSLVRLDGDTLASDPARLVDEARPCRCSAGAARSACAPAAATSCRRSRACSPRRCAIAAS